MAFDAEQRSISNKLLGQVVYTIPRNQRRYVWDERNWYELWNDLNFICSNDSKAHFIGSIVLMDKGEHESIQYYDIIDGQQRIITLILFVAAINQIYKERGEDDLYKGLKRFLLSTDLQSHDLCKVQSEYQPSIEVIINIICDPNNQSSQSEIVRQISIAKDTSIRTCFSYYYSLLSSLNTDLIRNIQKELLKTNYIEIIASTEEDSYTVFEILNARGMELEDYELLKNYIMRYTVPVTAIDRVKTEWVDNIESPLGLGITRFLTHYTRHRYRTSGTIEPYNTIKINNNASTINSLFEDLKKKALFYKKLITPLSPRDDGDFSEVEYRVFKFLKSNRGELFRPVILSLMSKRSEGVLSVQDYEKALLFIQYFFISYNLILQETSNKISDSIQKYAYMLENEYNRDVLIDFINHLISKMPTRDAFYNAFKLLGWSHHFPAYKDSTRKKKVQIVLMVLESITSSSNILPDFTIEHIDLDSENSENALIGNLLPLEESINSNCKNKSIDEKIDYYRQSNFKITRNFADYYNQNGRFDHNLRALQMAKKLYDEFNKIFTYFNT